jgi:Ca-activated chloride channel family protein
MKLTKSITLFTVIIVLLTGVVVFAELPEDADKTLSPYFLVKSDDPAVDQLPLLFTGAEVNIAGVIADVTVTQIYKNEGTRALEAIYVFPASTRAAVYGMTMTVGDRTIFAQIKERQQARQEYEQAKQEGKTASLLEQERPNVFQMNVANILPGDKIKVELKYTELLVPTDGVYEFVYPTVVGPRYSNKPAAGAAQNDQWVANPYLPEGEKPTYLFDISTHLATGIPLQEIGCASHRVNIAYDGPAAATVTLDDTEIIEKLKNIKPERVEGVKTALKELYSGKDLGSLPAFYTKLFRIAKDFAQQDEPVIERQVVKQTTGDRDYVLRYRLAGGKIESGLLLYAGKDENFFLLMVQPPEQVKSEEIPPREYIFIMDVSGSMQGFPISISKKLLQNLVSGLRSNDTFNVVLFAGGSSVMSDHSIPATTANIKRALDLIDRQRGGGGTELVPALKRALALPKTAGVSRTIVIATDGYVDVELETFDLIRNNLNKANMFAFGIGSSVNRFLIEGIAHVGMGEPFVILNPKEADGKAAQFRQYIQTPVLTNITVDFGEFAMYDVEPIGVPDVLAKRPVILFGKWKGESAGVITLSGATGAAGYEQTFNVNDVKPLETNSALRYLWARKRIEILGDYNALQGNDERKQAMTNLGLTYNLLTAYTSFVAIDSEIRRKEGELDTVKQPLPLPQGVSNSAIGAQSAAPMVQQQSAPSGGSHVSTTPEPDTMMLIAIAILVLAYAFLRKRRACKNT